MTPIHKIKVTEQLLRVHYYQFFNIKNFYLGFQTDLDYDIDKKGLNNKYPGFLETFDFSNVNVYDLHKFIRIETRGLSDFTHIPKYLYCFWDGNIDDLLNIGDFENFPLLFTNYKSSFFNDLIEVNYYHRICVFNQNAEFLNISVFPNLYDDGFCELTFLNEQYFVISFYDDNNGHGVNLYKYINGQVRSHDIDSLELIKLLDENEIIWELRDLPYHLKNDKEFVLEAVKQNGSALKFASDDLKSGEKLMSLAKIKIAEEDNDLPF